MSDADKYILSAAEIDTMQAREKTHFLNENARRHEKALSAETGLSELGFTLVVIEPGDESTEHHKHYHEEECLYVLEGQGQARIGAEVHEIRAGDFIGCRKGGLAHSFKNTGKYPLRCIVVSQYKDHDVSDYPRLGKRLFRNKDLTWNMVDLAVIDRPFGAKT
ncbi:MAG: cupin domain-containing protein [Paracoccaceae bacterium]|nr:cupin domain-containing protein [Paracoccaceae bacterium]